VKRFGLILLSLTAFLAVVPSAPAAGSPIEQFEFKLREGGFLVTVESEIGEEKVVLRLDRQGEVAYYEAPAKITESSLKARFGQMGELDYTFTPSGRPGFCAEPRKGTFEGAFTFTGENEYVKFEADRARGTVSGTTPAGCKKSSRAGASRRPVTKEAKPKEAEREATLAAHTRRPLPARSLLVLEFVDKGRPQVLFDAFLVEKKEGMMVSRGAVAVGPRSDFTWNLKAGTAHLDPPAPFTGSATYKRRPNGQPVWRGSLRAPVPGAAPIRLTGGEFVAQLIKGSILD
jgi:hypothetical protein